MLLHRRDKFLVMLDRRPVVARQRTEVGDQPFAHADESRGRHASAGEERAVLERTRLLQADEGVELEIRDEDERVFADRLAQESVGRTLEREGLEEVLELADGAKVCAVVLAGVVLGLIRLFGRERGGGW